MIELPPAHPLTAQQKAALRTNATARKVRAKFPRGTRVEGTKDMGETGTGSFGTVVAHIPMLNSQGGTIKVLWDHSPITGEPVLGRHSASGLRVVS